MIHSQQESNSLNDINLLSNSNVINSLNGFDTVYAGAENDIVVGSDGADILNGGEGIDTIDYRHEEIFGVTIDLSSNSASGGQAEGDLISNFENISGSKVNDRLIGNNENNQIVGGEGKDTLSGGEGKDIFRLENLNHSALSNFDIITDLNIEKDRIVVGENAVDITTFNQFGSVYSLDESSIQTVLSQSNFAANNIATFAYNSQVFLVLNDENPGYSANDDGIIEITGVEGLSTNNSQIENNNSNKELSNDSNNNDGKTINVNADFGGSIDNAIAAAKEGDTILLSNNTYYTNGITIDEDITIDGQEGSIIDGGGTSTSILYLTSGASGTTIQDLRITNGNNGINVEGAFDLTIQDLEIDNIGLSETIRDGQNNTAVILNRANGVQLKDTYIHDVGRKGVGINDTDGASVSNLTIQNINLAAKHAQTYDVAGLKLFNTNDVVIKDIYSSEVNAFNIWNDTTNNTKIIGNINENVGNVFAKPEFNQNVYIAGIYNEKSSNSIVRDNIVTAVDGFLGFKATEFSTKTMTLENNDFSSSETNTPDFWVNEEAEKLIATTKDPNEANFDLISEEYYAQANIR